MRRARIVRYVSEDNALHLPCSGAFLSPLLKFFHQLAKSFFSLVESLWSDGGGGGAAARGPPAPALAVNTPPLDMPSDSMDALEVSSSTCDVFCVRWK